MKKLLSLVLSLILSFSTLFCVPETIFADTEQSIQVETSEQSEQDTSNLRLDNEEESDEMDEELNVGVDIVRADTKKEYYKKVSELVKNQDQNVKVSDKSSKYESARLIVKSFEEMDLSCYEGLCKVVTDDKQYYIIQFETSNQAKIAAKLLQKLKCVEYVEPDQLITIDYEEDDENVSASATHHSWGTDRLGVDEYAAYANKRSTDQVVVAVVDSGVNVNHTFLSGRTVAGYDYVDNDSNPQDGNGHGTHVAGTVVDCTLNNTNIKIMPVRVLNNKGSGYSSDVADGIKYAADYGADVVNMSLGGGHDSYTDDAVEYATGKGVICVVAAGNESDDVMNHCPAHISDAVTVGSVDKNNVVSYFSNTGASVDVVAPGEDISSCYHANNTSFVTMSGTSMATPHIAGCIALIKQANPSYSVSQLDAAIKKCCKDLGTTGRDDTYGEGLPELDKLIDDKYETVSDWTKLESPHSYAANFDKTWEYKVDKDVLYMNVTFDDNTETESDHDYIYVNGKNGSVGQYTGTTLQGQTLKVDGNVVKIRLTSDASTSNYGFKVSDLKCFYNVSYDANGGSGAPESVVKEEGKNITLSNTTPTKTSKVTFNANGGTVKETYRNIPASFVSWNTKADGTGTSYQKGGTYSEDDSVTLYAKWQGAEIGELPTPTKATGGSFTGWYTESGTKVDKTTKISEDTTLYAHWTYTVTFDANGGSGAPDNITGETFYIPLAIPTRSFNVTYNPNGGTMSSTSKSVLTTFSSWNTKRDGTGTKYEYKITKPTYELTGDITLYAQWKSVQIGNLTNPTWSGNTFNGWYSQNGTKYTKKSTINDDITLIAHWNSTITFNANGGTGAPSSVTKESGTSFSIPNTKPSKTYTITYDSNGGTVGTSTQNVSLPFESWNTKQNGTGTDYKVGDNYTINGSSTLYAKWGDAKIESLPTPTLKDHNFLGWYTESGTKVEVGSILSGNVKLVAKWNCDLSEATIELGQNHYAFYDSAVKPTVVVKVGESIISSENYTVTYTNNTKAGNGTVTVTAKENTSCTGTASKNFDIHTLTKNAAHQASCTQAGNEEYYTCSCGKYFSDVATKNEIVENSWVLNPLGHNADKTDAKSATCTEDGNIEYYYCDQCKKYFTDKDCTSEVTKAAIVIEKLGHKAVKTDVKAATCTEDGNIEYYYCDQCKKYFTDKDCTNEVTKTATVKAKLGHKAVKTDAKAASCTEDGNIEYYYCDQCKKYFSDVDCTDEITKASTVKAKLGHKAVKTDAKAESCTEDGNIEYYYCDQCKKYFTDKDCTNEITKAATVIAKLPHDYDTINLVPATIDADGCSKYKDCKDCHHLDGKTIIKQIDATSITLSKTSFVVDGTEHKPTVTVLDVDGNELASGTDYDVTYNNNKFEGTGNAVITFKGNYSGEVTRNFAINKTDTTGMSVELSKTEYTYDGEAKEPAVTVYDAESQEIASSNYEVVYENNINAGDASVTVNFVGDYYEGSLVTNFTIHKAQYTLDVEQTQVKPRVGKTTQIKATGNGKIVYTSGSKSIASVSDTGIVKGVKIGASKITISIADDDNHIGVSKTIDVIVPTVITKAVLSASSYTYDNNAHKPSVKTVNGSTKFVKDTDYTVVYKDSADNICDEPTEVGTYKVIVTGIGNCDGTTTLTYKINQAAKTFSGVPTAVTAYISKDAPEISATTNDETAVSYKINSTKYADISASDGTCTITAKKAGTATLTISAPASKNYKAASKTVKITVKDPVNINSTKVTTVGKAYWNNGEAISPSVTVKSGKTTFKKDTDYKVNYELVNEQGESVSEWEVGNYVRVTVDATDENMLACKGSYTKDVKIEKASQPATATAPTTIYYGTGKEAVKIALANIPTTEGDEAPTISYTSSNKKYATVDDEGNITPLKAGKVTITVNIGATKHYAAKTIKLTVNVKAAVSLSSKNVKMTVGYNGGDNVVPTVTVTGYKLGDDYTVEYDNSGITQIGQKITVKVKAVTASGGCLGSYENEIIVGKGTQKITIINQPSSVKVKGTESFTVETLNTTGITVTTSSKLYATAQLLSVRPELHQVDFELKGIRTKSKITITVKAAENSYYKAATKTFTVKVVK